MIRALLFDAAGTLIEPAEPVAEVYARTAAGFGCSVSSRAVKEAFAAAFSHGGDPEWEAFPDGDAAERDWWARVVGVTFGRAYGSPLPEEIGRRCFEELFSHYAAPEAWRVFPEVPGVLAAAGEAGLRLAVVSNFDRRLHGILKGHALDFEVVVTSADARCRKPDARIFRHALSALGVPASEAWHAGDSATADLEGARAAGIRTFLLDRPRRDLRDFLNQVSESAGK